MSSGGAGLCSPSSSGNGLGPRHVAPPGKVLDRGGGPLGKLLDGQKLGKTRVILAFFDGEKWMKMMNYRKVSLFLKFGDCSMFRAKCCDLGRRKWWGNYDVKERNSGVWLQVEKCRPCSHCRTKVYLTNICYFGPILHLFLQFEVDPCQKGSGKLTHESLQGFPFDSGHICFINYQLSPSSSSEPVESLVQTVLSVNQQKYAMVKKCHKILSGYIMFYPHKKKKKNPHCWLVANHCIPIHVSLHHQ